MFVRVFISACSWTYGHLYLSVWIRLVLGHRLSLLMATALGGCLHNDSCSLFRKIVFRLGWLHHVFKVNRSREGLGEAQGRVQMNVIIVLVGRSAEHA